MYVFTSTNKAGNKVYINVEGFWVENKAEAELFEAKKDFYMESFFGTACAWEETAPTAINVEMVNEVYTSVSGELEGRVVSNAGNGHTYRVETRIVGKPYGWQFVSRYMHAHVACAELEAILNAN